MATPTQQFCLRWNNHQPNFIAVFSSLLRSETMCDVTLATEGKHILAHKIVLSACSSYFQVRIYGIKRRKKYNYIQFKQVAYHINICELFIFVLVILKRQLQYTSLCLTAWVGAQVLNIGEQSFIILLLWSIIYKHCHSSVQDKLESQIFI